MSIIDDQLIPEQAGFRPRKNCTSQILNLAESIEDSYEKRLTTGVVFIDLCAAYDTVNHHKLLVKLYEMTRDPGIVEIIQQLLGNRMFRVELCGKRSPWRKEKNGLPQGSFFTPMLFNIYINDQPIAARTRSFLDADDLAVATQHKQVNTIEGTLAKALEILSVYYKVLRKRFHNKPNEIKFIRS